MKDPTQLFKALSDTSRLRILASLHKEPMYVELISKRLDLHPSTVSFHLKKLEQLGIISSTKDQYYVTYHLNRESLNVNIMGVISSLSTENQSEEEREKAYYEKIKNTFIQQGKLISIPVQHKKRLVILQEIAKQFEIGKEYPEKEVNNIISEYHFDFCTIRREFIMNRMFERENGIYTRVK
jgi:hypothetical protein